MMNVMQKCCFRSMKENRKRTAVTIVGVILATALITGVACLIVSFHASIVEYEKLQNGDYHYWFSGVEAENLKYFEHNRHIRRIALAEPLGYALLSGSQNPDKPYLYIRAVDEAGIKALPLKLFAGRMPENASELVVSRHIVTNGLVKLGIGDVLTLDVGERLSGGEVLNQQNPYTYEEEKLETYETRVYTIVGMVERPNYTAEERMAPGYSVFTYLEEPAGSLEVYATYTDWGLKNAARVNAGILGVSEDLYTCYYKGSVGCTEEEALQLQAVAKNVVENYWLNKWLLFSFSSATLNMLYAMAAVAVAVIIVTSVFCIRNSFTISLTEKIKLYGRLASVGATCGQQRRIVYYEAAVLGLAGIPAGILSGILGTWILVRAVSGLVESAIDIPFVFGISLPAVVAAVILSAVTIFFSAFQSAGKAAKVSPISAVRGNDMVKIRRREVKCPAYIDRLFGVGGRVAYKNLKRARVKYRTTVVSIVVSVAVFVGMTTFVQSSLAVSSLYYDERRYQIVASLYDEDAYEKAERIAALADVQEAELVRKGVFHVSGDSIALTEGYRAEMEWEPSETESIWVYSMGDAAYGRFCKEVGVSAAQAEDKAIVYAEYNRVYWGEEDNKLHSETKRMAEFAPGDVLTGVRSPNAAEDVSSNAAEGASGNLSVEVLVQTDKQPFSMDYVSYNAPVCIVSDSWMDTHRSALDVWDHEEVQLFLRCRDAAGLEETVRRDMGLVSYDLSNYAENYRSTRSTFLVISIFLYGFIAVVALIGITNVFNTVTTNMELRAPEFAMLRAIGMTDREFRRMIWLEGLFYGGKALLIGLPLGLALSLLFHRAMGEGVVMRFRWPVGGMAFSAAAVFLLLYGIMGYSMGRLKQKDLIQTIQNENI